MVQSSNLLQSHAWEQFQRALGRRTWRVDGTLVIAMPLPLGGMFLYAPRGAFLRRGGAASPPTFAEAGTLSVSPTVSAGGHAGPPLHMAAEAETIAHENGAVFLRAECSQQLTTHNSQPATPRVLRRAVEPEWTWRVSLEPEEDAMLAAMHEKHRYNVRLAERRGVRATSYQLPARPDPSVGAASDQFNAFWSLLQETARRQGIGTHPRGYYDRMLRMLSCQLPATSSPRPERRGCKQETDCKLYIAERDGVPCSAAIVAYHGDTATYLHGGSSHAQRQHMAPHLLHWQAMRDAKHAGMRWYDFGGVEKQIPTPSSSPSRREEEDRYPHASAWSGMTRFKQGFGGEAMHHPPMCDLVFRPGWYTLCAWMARMHP